MSLFKAKVSQLASNDFENDESRFDLWRADCIVNKKAGSLNGAQT
jgi:hypothetical protein